MRLHKYLTGVAYLTLALTITIIGYGLALLLWPYPLPVNKDETVKVISKTVKPGEPVIIGIDVCYPQDEQLLVYRKLHLVENDILQRVYNLPELKVNIKKGCYATTTGSNIVPEIALPGTYYLEFTTVIEANALRKIQFTYKTEIFEVKP